MAAGFKGGSMTIIIESRDDLKKYGSVEEGYEFPDDVVSEVDIETLESIDAGGSIRTAGSLKAMLYIAADNYIIARRCIESGEFIGAGGVIESDQHILAGGFLRSESNIRAIGPITAGGFIAAQVIQTQAYVLSYEFRIEAQEIWTKTLPFGRSFWDEMQPEIYLERPRTVLMDGWHWILKGHMECFLGMKKFFQPPGQ